MRKPALIQRRDVGRALGAVQPVGDMQQLHRFQYDTLGPLQGAGKHFVQVRTVKIIGQHG
ncbi:hypothetical protein PS3A_02220 [Pseudomonas sp. 3A(2025)]